MNRIEVCGSYVVNFLNWTLNLEWSIARHVVKNGHHRDTCYKEIELCAHYLFKAKGHLSRFSKLALLGGWMGCKEEKEDFCFDSLKLFRLNLNYETDNLCGLQLLNKWGISYIWEVLGHFTSRFIIHLGLSSCGIFKVYDCKCCLSRLCKFQDGHTHYGQWPKTKHNV